MWNCFGEAKTIFLLLKMRTLNCVFLSGLCIFIWPSAGKGRRFTLVLHWLHHHLQNHRNVFLYMSEGLRQARWVWHLLPKTLLKWCTDLTWLSRENVVIHSASIAASDSVNILKWQSSWVGEGKQLYWNRIIAKMGIPNDKYQKDRYSGAFWILIWTCFSFLPLDAA